MNEETKALTIPVQDIRMMAEAVAKSGLFGMKTADQAMALMLIAHAEGLHPAIAARDYHIIQNRPSKSAEAMQRSFQAAGGKIEWHELTDEKASATFSHPQGGSVRIDWDLARAKKAGLESKDNWKKWPRQMLRARVISEGTRTVWPGATSGMYTPEEVKDFDEPKGKQKTKKDAPGTQTCGSCERTLAPDADHCSVCHPEWGTRPEPDPSWKGLAIKQYPAEGLVWMVEHGTAKQQVSAQTEIRRRTDIEAKAAIPTERLESESADIVDAEQIATGEQAEMFP